MVSERVLTLFQRVKASLHLFRLLTLQLNNGPAVKADLTVHVEDLTLLLVDGGADVILYVVDGPEPIFQPVQPRIQCQNPIIETIIHDHHSSFQLLVTHLGGLNLVDQIGPNVIQHLDRIVSLRRVNVKLHKSQTSDPILLIKHSHWHDQCW